MHFLNVQSTLAWYWLPVALVHMIANDGRDNTVSVDHTDVRSVGEVQYIVSRNSHPFGICKFGITSKSTIATMSFVARQTALA